MATVINVNGRIATGASATIPVLDHGFLYGEGVYEVLPHVSRPARCCSTATCAGCGTRRA